MKKHDESKDVQALNRAGIRAFPGTKTIEIDKSQVVGIKQWGRIDYLTHYCGWHVVKTDRNAQVVVKKVNKRRKKNIYETDD